MDIKAQVSNWVENKIGQIIDEDLKVKVVRENSPFDINAYVNSLQEKYFTKAELENLKNTLNTDFELFVNDFDFYDSDEESNSKDSLEFDNHEFQTFSVEEIVKNLESNSNEIRVKSLQALEVYAEEVISHSSWIVVQKTLLKILKGRGDTNIHDLVLKVFYKFLICTNQPKIVCNGFASITKALASLLTLKDDNVSYEEIYDLRGDRWFHKKSVSGGAGDDHYLVLQKSVHMAVLIKLMWLLIQCQLQMPEKWVRFNEKRLREIIFSFVHLLSTTNSGGNENFTALQLLSILNPTASWCRSWCHTAVGRNLICSAFRKYKNFFTSLIETILNKIKTKRQKHLKLVRNNEVISKHHSERENEISSFREQEITDEIHTKERAKVVRSAPTDLVETYDNRIFWRVKKNSKWVTESIPNKVINEAMFWHSVSVVTFLIQFRCGRALFPVQTAARKRSLSAQDISLSLIEYFETRVYNKNADGFGFTIAYQAEVLKKVEILKTFRNNILSSRMKLE